MEELLYCTVTCNRNRDSDVIASGVVLIVKVVKALFFAAR
jgi:hypothetical protein